MKYDSLLKCCLVIAALLILSACAPKQPLAEFSSEQPVYSYSDGDHSAYREVILAPEGKLSGNTMVFGDSPDMRQAYVVYGVYTDADGPLSENTLTFIDGNVADSVYGAYTEGLARNNVLIVNNGKIADRVEAGHGRKGSSGNKLYLHNGVVGALYGGYSSDGPADNNFLQVTGGKVLDDVQAGLSLRSSASGNTVQIDGGVIEDQVYGGYGMEGPATGNTAIVTGGTVKSDVNGAVSSTHAATGNTVILRGSPLLGRSIYGGFAVGEYGDAPDTITGNRILFESFNAELDDLWNAEEVQIDQASRLSNRERGLNFYNCRKINNNGVIALAAESHVFLDASAYSGKGLFELGSAAHIGMRRGMLNAPLRIKMVLPESLPPFSRVLLVELAEVKFGRNLSTDNAVQLVENRLGGLTLTLEHEQVGSYEYWYVSGR